MAALSGQHMPHASHACCLALLQGDADMCWICLEEESESGSAKLISPCKCPRKVHPQCLARWQLQQAGRQEEKNCRFGPWRLGAWL